MVYSWIYVFVNAFSALLRQISGDFISPALLLLCSCYLAICYFHLVNLPELKRMYQQCWNYKKNWLSISALVTGIWLSAIYSPTYIGASYYTFFFFATNGILGMSSRYWRGSHHSLCHGASLLGLFSLVFIVAITSFVSSNIDSARLVGTVLAVVGGIAGFKYSKQSAIFMKKANLSASQVLAVRFYLTMLICIFLLPSNPFTQLTIANLFLALIVSIFCLIIPLYFVQKGIEKAGPELNAIIASTVPLIATILEKIYFHHVDQYLFLACMLYSLFTCLPYMATLLMMLIPERAH